MNEEFVGRRFMLLNFIGNAGDQRLCKEEFSMIQQGHFGAFLSIAFFMEIFTLKKNFVHTSVHFYKNLCKIMFHRFIEVNVVIGAFDKLIIF